jgi:hypothetical protein
LRDQDLGKIGSAVMRIAVVAAAALIALAVILLIGFALQRMFRGRPIRHHEAPHPPALLFGLGQMKPS